MSLFSGLGTLLVMLTAWLMDFSSTYTILTSFIVSLYIAVIVLNFFGEISLARYFISVGSPIWISIVNFLIGGNFCQGLAILASMAITYVAFQKTPLIKIGLLVFHIVIFFPSSIYVNTFGPLLGVIDFPYDELTVFVGGLGWTIIVLYKFNKDRNNLLRNLEANNKELKNTTEELERFTYIASHDLKSPLRTIVSFIGLIERDINKEDYSNIHKNLSFVKTGAEQMNFLVRDILELSRLKEHDKSERSLIDLNLVFEKVSHNLKEEIRERNALVHCEKLPLFSGIELEFLLLFQNFIQNGIKYNESKQPTVRVFSSEVDKTLRLSFEDNGIGIEEEYHEQIFQFFKRLHNSIKYQGTGLGLGLCKKIINNYDGQIETHSKPGAGTTFTILLPLEQINEANVEVLEEVDA